MNDKAILGMIRKFALWAVLGSAALLLILEILKVWNLIETTSGGEMPDVGNLLTNALMGGELSLDALSFSAPSPNAWGHIEGTLAIILGLGSVVLLALLVSSRTRLGKGAAGKGKVAKSAAAPAKSAAPATKAAPATRAAAKPKK
jgi:hypothetical protein